ncbi:hypothetical protein BH10ACT7_BH10ACT7_04350 [soil metagenome]
MTTVGPGSTPELPESTVPAAFRSPKPASSAKRKSSFLSIAVTALVVPGLFATVALPAYAFSPAESTEAADASAELQAVKADNAQAIKVDDEATALAVSRDAFAVTSAAEMQRAALAAAYASYSGPSAADFLANPPYPNFDLGQVANVALQYQGVPYAYGGADPSGFDCSGLVMYVYAQFGIALPHSVSGIAAMGTPIAREAALPGDIVTMSGHNGIYMGNGTFIDAPSAGRSVVVRPIYTDDYYIVRIGI